MVGAAAFTAGVTHTVSIALIVFELTNQLSYMLPVLLAVLVSRMVSGRSTLHPGGIFSLIGKQLNLYIDPVLGNDSSYVLTVEELLHRRSSSSSIIIDNEEHNGHVSNSSHRRSTSNDIPVVIRSITQHKLKRLLGTFSSCSEFAVVDSSLSMLFLGTVSRRELEEIAESDALFAHGSGAAGANRNVELIKLAAKIQEFETKDSTDSLTEETKQTFATLTSTEAKNSFPPLDLVGAELLDLDFTMCIKATACLSECVLKFSSGHAQSLFLLKRGRVVGLLHVSDISEIGL